MGTTFASIGIAVESSQAVKAADDLDKLVNAALSSLFGMAASAAGSYFGGRAASAGSTQTWAQAEKAEREKERDRQNSINKAVQMVNAETIRLILTMLIAACETKQIEPPAIPQVR